MKKKQKASLTFDVKIDIFNAVVTVHLGTFDELRDYVDKKYSMALQAEDKSIDGFLADLDKDYGISGACILCVKNFFDVDRTTALGILVHEALHAVRAIFRSRGVPFAGDNEETIAYTQEYIVGAVLKQVNKIDKERGSEEDA